MEIVVNERYEKEEICFSIETIDRIHSMDVKLSELYPVLMAEIPKMQMLLSTITTAQNSMAMAAASMASTNEKAERRYEKMEERLQEANDKASGKGQIPIMSHYITLGGTVLIAILVILYVNKQTLDATLTSVKISGQETQKAIKEELQRHEEK